MSHAHDPSAHPKTEDDRIDSRTVVLVGVGALVVFTMASIAAGTYLYQRNAERPTLPIPAEIGQTKIGLVEQRLFELPQRGAGDRAARLKRLGGYGWVDEQKQVAHIPIEVAMGLVAAGVRVAPTDPPTAPPLSASRGGVDAPSVPIAGEAPPAPAAATRPAAPAPARKAVQGGTR